MFLLIIDYNKERNEFKTWKSPKKPKSSDHYGADKTFFF